MNHLACEAEQKVDRALRILAQTEPPMEMEERVLHRLRAVEQARLQIAPWRLPRRVLVAATAVCAAVLVAATAGVWRRSEGAAGHRAGDARHQSLPSVRAVGKASPIRIAESSTGPALRKRRAPLPVRENEPAATGRVAALKATPGAEMADSVAPLAAAPSDAADGAATAQEMLPGRRLPALSDAQVPGQPLPGFEHAGAPGQPLPKFEGSVPGHPLPAFDVAAAPGHPLPTFAEATRPGDQP